MHRIPAIFTTSSAHRVRGLPTLRRLIQGHHSRIFTPHRLPVLRATYMTCPLPQYALIALWHKDVCGPMRYYIESYIFGESLYPTEELYDDNDDYTHNVLLKLLSSFTEWYFLRSIFNNGLIYAHNILLKFLACTFNEWYFLCDFTNVKVKIKCLFTTILT